MNKDYKKIFNDIKNTKEIIKDIEKQINTCKNDKDREKLNESLMQYKIILDHLLFKKWENG